MLGIKVFYFFVKNVSRVVWIVLAFFLPHSVQYEVTVFLCHDELSYF